ncbi:MAG: hypothetical protein H0W63_05980 [Gemmatimonadaceae bacterium]|nr:hypothetical protein [Gemmatimonadaceae bacterium]
MRSIVFPLKFSVLKFFDESERRYAVSIQIWSLDILPPQAGIPSGLPWYSISPGFHQPFFRCTIAITPSMSTTARL